MSVADFAAEGVQARRDIAACFTDYFSEPLLEKVPAGEQNLRTIVVCRRWRRRRVLIWHILLGRSVAVPVEISGRWRLSVSYPARHDREWRRFYGGIIDEDDRGLVLAAAGGGGRGVDLVVLAMGTPQREEA
ncbi:hypothetical protein [Candidatus Accumulibacter sp. ACC007]|uniref:hypothetical protein n=1 Tax=Candidatus Accumulibacter sp. ACC007 TaxID=2823333 RepID=UPI0025C5B9A4|nr:hypothetical protein [Candidatus Accumulibacter sp. ACC007]